MKIPAQSVTTFRESLAMTMFRVVNAADSGLTDASARAFTLAQNKVPRATGALASSASLNNHNSGVHLQRTISYGDATINPKTGKATANYALAVHEVYNPAQPSSYKWLEFAMHEYGQETFLHELASAIRASL